MESLIGILDALDEKPSAFFNGAYDEKIVFKPKDRVELEIDGVKMFQILVPAAQNRMMDRPCLCLVQERRLPRKSPMRGRSSVLSWQEA